MSQSKSQNKNHPPITVPDWLPTGHPSPEAQPNAEASKQIKLLEAQALKSLQQRVAGK